MWAGSREALVPLDLDSRECVLDVGCGTGVLTRVLEEETDARVVGVDADRDLLAVAREGGSSVVAGDALRLPFRDGVSERRSEAREKVSRGAFDLVVCQALLINLPDPGRAVAEFARVSSELVAAVEPDNAAVEVESSADDEESLERRVREAYLDGVETDVTLGGSGTRRLFEDAGLTGVSTVRYPFEKATEPPYAEAALVDARRKASGEGLASHRETLLAGDLSPAEYESLRGDWRAMGRDVIAQMQDGDYRRTEVVPFYVTVGRT
jgi:SAM-dependent methyltransferase